MVANVPFNALYDHFFVITNTLLLFAIFRLFIEIVLLRIFGLAQFSPH